MHGLTQDVMKWLLVHHGVISTTELHRLGVVKKQRLELVDRGVLVPVHKRVYRIASSPLTLEARCVALCLLHPKGFITGPTAGKLLGLRRMPKSSELHLCVPHGLEIDPPGVAVRQSRRVEATDVQHRQDGINIATPWRLAFDLAADLKTSDHASVLEDIMHKRLCGIGAFVQTAKRLAYPSRPGSARFVENLTSRVRGGPLESHAEVEVAQALSARGIPITAQSTWLTLPNGHRARIDISVPDIRWGLEVDAHPSHLLLDGTTRDKRRDRQARLLGWQIDRVTDLDLVDLPTTIDELVRLYHLRCDEIRMLDQPAS